MQRIRNRIYLAITSALLVWATPQLSNAEDSSAYSVEVPSGPSSISSSETSTGSAPIIEQAPAQSAQPAQSTQSTDAATPSLVTLNPVGDADLWARIRGGYAIPDLDNQLVNNQLNWYSTRTDYIQRTVQRASRYLYHVVGELEKRGMPTELALLPFIESAFNPQALSTAKASGMWQFMASTGRDFNLKQTMFIDDRRGVLDSTDAALNYLERLYGMFGDWQLALAAYNWGEGSVQRAIKKQQALGLPVDFDSMSNLMPLETRNYLPKLQAVKNIISHPEQFNVDLPKLENQPYFVTVEKTRDIDVRVAAQLAEMSVSDFTALNPQFNRPVITGGSNTKILLPTDNATLFKENLSKWNGPLSSWSTQKVAKTEHVEALANRLHVKPELLREVNLIPANMLVKAGSTILVPKAANAPDQDISLDVAENAQLVFEKNLPGRQVNYKVGKRDSLNSIAHRYRVSVAQLKSWNGLKRDNVSAGQTLEIHLAPIMTASRGRANHIVASRQNSRINHTVIAKKSQARIILASAKSAKKHHG